MTLLRKLRSYFLTPTSVDRADGTHGGVRFLKTDKPTQETMNRLIDSAAFLAESADRAKPSSGGDLEDEQGLTVLASDAQAKSNAVQLSDRSLVAQPHQLPTVNEGAANADDIAGSFAPFAGVAMDVAPDATATRNNFIVKLSTNFKAWLGGAIDALSANISTVSTNLSNFIASFSGGSNGQVLTNTGSGYTWANPTSGLPATGSNGQVLTVVSGAPAWASPAAGGATQVPIGGIIMYSGVVNFDINGIGTGPLLGYALCNGFDGITPDLTGRFIVGSNKFGMTQIGGTYTDASGSYPYAVGDTNVGGAGEAKHLLTALESGLRDHKHVMPGQYPNQDDAGSGSGTDLVTPNGATTYNTTSPIDADGNASLDGAQPAANYHENRPPYYALAFIMRIA